MINSVDHFQLFNNPADKQKATSGLKIARVVTTYPDEVTLVLEGCKFALDMSVFEMPVNCYPLLKNDRFLAFPMYTNGVTTRYGIINKLTTGQPMGIYQNPSGDPDAPKLLIDGMDTPYKSTDIILGGGLINGDRVTVTPTWSGGKVKYIITKP